MADTDVSASGTNAVVTATLPAVAGKVNQLMGVIITGLPGTALASGDVTITGLNNGTWTQEFCESVTETAILSYLFPYARSASAPNTAISVSVAALGALSGKVSVQAIGQV